MIDSLVNCCCKSKKEKDEGRAELSVVKNAGTTRHPKAKRESNEEEEKLIQRGKGGNTSYEEKTQAEREETISLQDKFDSADLEKEKDIDDIEVEDLAKAIKESKIDELLKEVHSTLNSLEPISPLQQISKPTDPLQVYFAVVDSPDGKEKAHKFLSFYEVDYDPKYFVLRNSLLSAEERLKSNSNLQSYETIARRKIGDTYYMVNHAVFKKIMLITQRDSLMIKAFKFLENGDCIEHNMSIDYPKVPENKSVSRIKTLSNPIYYQKTERGLKAKSYNHVLPQTNLAFMILKPILGSSYNNTFKAILDIIKAEPIGTAEDLAKLF